jgi:adenosylcobinamide-phosphate synthase
MDAMVGHRSQRYARFGTAAARLDDAMAWVPARVFALLVAAVRPDRAGQVLRTVRRDAPGHPSPNAGVAESAAAGALGVELGGPLRYGDRVEERPRLGDGPRPTASTITAARRLVDRVELALAAGAAAAWVLSRRCSARR